MKKVPFRKSLLATALVLSISLTSCKNETVPADSKEVAEEQNEAVVDEAKEELNEAEDNSQVYIDVAEFDLTQKELAVLAQKRAVSPDIKALAKKIADGHTASLKELADATRDKGITVPTTLTENGKKEVEALNNEKGQDFDVEYIDKAINSHKDAIQKFKNEASKAKNPEFKAWLDKKVAELQGHFDMINDLIAKSRK
jgi:putative membrane protein